MEAWCLVDPRALTTFNDAVHAPNSVEKLVPGRGLKIAQAAYLPCRLVMHCDAWRKPVHERT